MLTGSVAFNLFLGRLRLLGAMDFEAEADASHRPDAHSESAGHLRPRALVGALLFAYACAIATTAPALLRRNRRCK